MKRISHRLIDDLPRLGLLLLAPLAVVACMWWWLGGQWQSGGERGGPIKIGAILCLSGETGFLGDAARKVLVGRVQEINAQGGVEGRPLELVIHDSGGESSRAQEAARSLAMDAAVVAVIGPSHTNESVAVMPLLEKAGIPQVTLCVGHKVVDPCRPWTFRLGASERNQAGCMVDWLVRHQVGTVALLASDRTSARSGLKQFELQSTRQGVRTVLSRRCSRQDPLAESHAWLEQVSRSRAGALVMWGSASESAAVARMVRNRRMSVTVIFGLGAATREFLREAGEAGEGCLMPASPLLICDSLPSSHPQKQELVRFKRWFEDKYHLEASPWGGQAWDTLRLLTDALRATGARRAHVRAWLEETVGFVGATGILSYSPVDHDGLDHTIFTMVTPRAGRWSEAR